MADRKPCDIERRHDSVETHSLDRRRFLGGLALGAGALATLAASRSIGAATSSRSPSIVITTPTGTIGSQVLTNVLERGVHVRIITRDPSRIPSSMHERIEIVQGSHGDIEVCKRAFEGADTVFWVCPPNPGAESVMAAYVDFTRPACEAFKSGGVRRVVGISALGRGHALSKNAGYVTGLHAMDDLIASTGVSYCALTMPSFMDNIMRQAELIKHQGMFFSPISGDRKVPACATRDIAAVAANRLLDSSWNGRTDVPILGPEDMSFNDMALVMSEVLEKPVRFQQMSFEQYKSVFLERGVSEAMAQALTDMARAKDQGLDNAIARTPASSTPTSFRRWCEDELKPAILS
jgi:uncharacterized protein YbjT (DUF2867 family)